MSINTKNKNNPSKINATKFCRQLRTVGALGLRSVVLGPCLRFMIFKRLVALTEQPVDKYKDDDGAEAAAAPAVSAVSGDECAKPVLHV